MVNRMLERMGDEEAGSLAYIREREARSERRGKLEGKLEGKRETARRMKADGLADAAIARYTGLSLAEITQL